MKRAFTSVSTLLFASLALVACGGGADTADEAADSTAAVAPVDTGGAAPAGAAGAMPAWFRVNGNNVDIDVLAGATPDNNHWNFNGGSKGDMTITVPTGAMVTINFKNGDPGMVHSLGIAPMAATPAPAPDAKTPAFAGAITPDAADMAKATLSNEKDAIHFTADKPGEYMVLCYIPGHGVAGMWIKFVVGGEAGVTGDKGAAVSVN
jgi:hypothetical protein